MQNIIIGIIIIIPFIWSIYTFNQFIKLKNLIQTSWSDIDVYLTKRHELIPNLVEVVKSYMSHEKETLENVVRARNNAISAKNSKTQIPFENNIGHFLSRLFVLAEDYPELKANESFHKLHHQLIDIENEIADARRYYNAVVRDNNNQCEVFPALIIGKVFGFNKQNFFDADINAEKTIEIKID